ncbi:pyridine nucleotide-disulfide oxidoreductase [Gordonia sp. ABSL49_1]|uniref:pyridine nucleotide-disulfide oxidoreductase n=1 Tax=Gordonia sp. ABSL49_1 TaxID=2920941 RepID=UPI001F0E1208|nr:pyridine nucleotide-disulfide oxidoreductase [Gordonia sp. ABSL49_1]MCH5644581.1 pyridine nucleotide-disulfide oxidoreductase [Gordonia sp. ABSL49_1]
MNTDTTSEAITYIDDAPRSPRPMWRLARSGAVTLACMSFALVAACSFSIGDDDAVENSDDISIGECLQIGDSLDGGKVKATKVDCDTTDGLSFYAAEIISENAQCGSKNTSTLTFADGDKKLCMTPNFETTSCYQIPLSGGSLVDYRKVAAEPPPRTRQSSPNRSPAQTNPCPARRSRPSGRSSSRRRSAIACVR